MVYMSNVWYGNNIMRAKVINGVVYPVEPTSRQRKAAKALSESIKSGRHMSKKDVVLAGDYSRTVANRPTLVTESKGFQIALAELGLTKELVVSALQEDIKAKPGRRAFELSIAGKWLGLEQKGEQPSSALNIQNAVIIIKKPE